MASSSVVGTVRPMSESSVNGISPPDFGEGWEDEKVSDEAYRFDWKGIRAEQTDLKNAAGEFAADSPSIASFLAIRANPSQMIRNDNEDTSSRVTLGGGPIPASWSINNPSKLIQENTCGVNPYTEATTEFAQEIYTQKTRDLHNYESEPSIQDGLQKDWSVGCLWEFGYEKPEYQKFGFTFETEWEAGDDDQLESFDLRGLLSIERTHEEFLLVGGMVPDESVSTGLLGEEIIEDKGNLQSSLVSLMEGTMLTEE